MIRDKLQVAQSRQKSYADIRRKPLEFEESDHVFLRVSPTTGIGRAIRGKKLSPCFLGPFQITEKVGPVAYRVALPPSLSNLHDVFHVSQLRKYVPDPSHIVEPEFIQLKPNLTFESRPLRIMDHSVKCNAPQVDVSTAPHYSTSHGGTSHNSLVGQNPPPVRTLCR